MGFEKIDKGRGIEFHLPSGSDLKVTSSGTEASETPDNLRLKSRTTPRSSDQDFLAGLFGSPEALQREAASLKASIGLSLSFSLNASFSFRIYLSRCIELLRMKIQTFVRVEINLL